MILCLLYLGRVIISFIHFCRWESNDINENSFPSCLFLLLISHKGPEFPDFRVDLFVKVKSIFLSVSDLEKVVIKSLFGDADFIGGSLKRTLNIVSIFIIKASVELSPKSNFFHNFPYFLFFLLVVFIILCLIILDPLLLNKSLNHKFLFASYLNI